MRAATSTSAGGTRQAINATSPPNAGAPTASHTNTHHLSTGAVKPRLFVSGPPANPVKVSRTHQELHKELLLAHKKGLVMCRRPELHLVLERRRKEQTEKEEGEQNRTPLERVLLQRQQINQEKEKQLEKAKEDPQLLEFLRVRENLKKIHSRHMNEHSGR
ncbi:actin-associated protein FAM107A [Paramormyrops kingsleyae]|uniref:Protein FAM107B-like n=1 Tax=Paramormyrops kingsleyae TaxID=1676925 RepID=A0A3B3S150_9TELE|nr:protein FAM107B-like [Paramormyrops kingsleyae]XP_023693355.1 protein FAM107B-like [Paramormyrops kingsleyae]